jgi:hypothetical protein
LAGRATETNEAPSWCQLSSVYTISLLKRARKTPRNSRRGHLSNVYPISLVGAREIPRPSSCDHLSSVYSISLVGEPSKGKTKTPTIMLWPVI